MVDARTNSHTLFRKGPLKVIAIITLWSFLFTTIGSDIVLGKAWAATTPLEPSSVGSNRPGSSGHLKELNPETFALPQYLGQIKDRYNANSDKIIIHIQDAHCNYYAQNKIAEIIEYLNKEHGINTIDLEGGARSYDLSIFTDIDDRSVRQRVSGYFLKEGMINGAEYFAVNNPGKVTLWGAEDTKLYLENLDIYRDSLKNKDEIDKALNSISHTLDNLKARIYSADLLELDQKYSQYKINNLDFKAYLGYLLQKAKGLMIDAKSFSNIYLLSQTIEQESRIDFRKANAERDMLIDKLQKRLSKKALEELVQKTVEFTREIISQKDFYQYLLNRAKSAKLDLKDFPTLQSYIVYISIYEAADKSKLMDEMEELENKIKEALYQNERQKELDRLSKTLVITTNIFNILLTKKDYEYYRQSEASFGADNYISFINKEAPLYKISTALDDSVKRLDQYRGSMARFYEYSFKRDEVFLKNMKLGKGPLDDRVGTGKTAIFISGGFHTENLCKLFKANNISYVSIIPYFKNSEGYQCPYYNLLVGKNNKLVDSLLADNFLLAVFTHLCDAANDVYVADRQRAWEISVRVAESFFRGEASCAVIDGGRRICFSFDPQGGNPISGFTIDNKQVFARIASKEEIVRAAKRSLTGWQRLKRKGIILFLALLALNANVFQPSTRPILAPSKPPAALVKFDTAAYVGAKSDRTSITETEYRALKGRIPQLADISYEDFRRDQPTDQQKETIQSAINLAMATDGKRAGNILDVIKHIVILDVDYPAMAIEGGFVIMGRNHLKNITNENILRGWILVLMHEGRHIKDAGENKPVFNQRDLASQAKGEESAYEETLYWTEKLGYDQQAVDAQRFVYEHIKDAGYKGLMASFVTVRTQLEGNAFFAILTADKILSDMHKGQLPKGAQIEYLGYYNATHQGRKCFNLEYKIGEKIYRVFVGSVEEGPGIIKVNFLEQPKEIDKKESVYYSLDVQSSIRSGEENGAAIRQSEVNLNAVEHLALNQAIAELIDPQAHRVGVYEGLNMYAIPNLMGRFREILMTMANPYTGALYTEVEAEAAADIIAHAGHRRGNIYMDADVYNRIRGNLPAIQDIARHERGHLDEYRRRAAAAGYTNLDDIADDITARFYATEDELGQDIESERAKRNVITLFNRQAGKQLPGGELIIAEAPLQVEVETKGVAVDVQAPQLSINGNVEYPTGLSPPNREDRARNLDTVQRRNGFVARRLVERANLGEDARDTAIGVLANIRNGATYGAVRNLIILAANAFLHFLLNIIQFFANRPGIERVFARLTLGGTDVRTQIQTFIGVARELVHAFALERNGFQVQEFNVTEEGEIDLILRRRPGGELYIAEVQGGAGVAEKGKLLNWLVGEVKQHKRVWEKLGSAGRVSVADMARSPVPVYAPCLFSCSEDAFKGSTTSKDEAEAMLRNRLAELLKGEKVDPEIATAVANTVHLVVINERLLNECQDAMTQQAEAIAGQYNDTERIHQEGEREFDRNMSANMRTLLTRLQGFNVRVPQLLLRGLFDRYGFDEAGMTMIMGFFERIGRDRLPHIMGELEGILNAARIGEDRYNQVLAFITRFSGINVDQGSDPQAGSANIVPPALAGPEDVQKIIDDLKASAKAKPNAAKATAKKKETKPPINKGEDDGPIIGAMHEGGVLFQEIKDRLGRVLDRFGWDVVMGRLEAKRTAGDRQLVRNALEQLWPAGITEELLSRIIPVNVGEKRLQRVLETGATDELGGLIVRHNGILKVLFPRHRLAKLLREGVRGNETILGDLLHEVIEVELLEAGMQGDEAHHQAMRVRNAFLEQGPAGAARVIKDLRNPTRLGEFEQTFEDIVPRVLSNLNIQAEDLAGLNEEGFRKLREEFLKALKASGWDPSPKFEKLFSKVLEVFINKEQVAGFKERFKRFDRKDLVLLLQRLHTFTIDMPKFGVREEVLQYQNLTHMIQIMQVSSAMKLRVLEKVELAGAVWENTPPDQSTLRLLQQGRLDEVLRRFGTPRPLHDVLPDLKAICLHFGINVAKMEDNFIINLGLGFQAGRGDFIERINDEEFVHLSAGVANDFVVNGIFWILKACIKPEALGVAEITKFVAKGFDGIVLAGRGPEDQPIVVKINFGQNGRPNAEFINMLLEVTQHTDRHPNFVKNFNILEVPLVRGQKSVFEVNEFVEGVTLQDLMNRMDFWNISAENCADMLIQLMEADKFLIDNAKCLNKDVINMRNFVVTRDGTVRLVDFGNIHRLADIPQDQRQEELVSHKKLMALMAARILVGVMFAGMETSDREIFGRLFASRFGEQYRQAGERIHQVLLDAWQANDADLSTLIQGLRDIFRGFVPGTVSPSAQLPASTRAIPPNAIVGAMHAATEPAQLLKDMPEPERRALIDSSLDFNIPNSTDPEVLFIGRVLNGVRSAAADALFNNPRISRQDLPSYAKIITSFVSANNIGNSRESLPKIISGYPTLEALGYVQSILNEYKNDIPPDYILTFLGEASRKSSTEAQNRQALDAVRSLYRQAVSKKADLNNLRNANMALLTASPDLGHYIVAIRSVVDVNNDTDQFNVILFGQEQLMLNQRPGLERFRRANELLRGYIRVEGEPSQLLLKGGNIWAAEGRHGYGIADFVYASLTAIGKPTTIQRLFAYGKNVPGTSVERLEKNRRDALELQGFGTLRDYIHDQHGGVNKVITALVDYYDAHVKGDTKATRDAARRFRQASEGKGLRIKLGKAMIAYFNQTGPAGEKNIDILRRLEKNTAVEQDSPPRVASVDLKTGYPEFDKLLQELFRNTMHRGRLDVLDLYLALHEANQILKNMSATKEQGVMPNFIIALIWLENQTRRAFNEIEESRDRDHLLGELYKTAWFAKVVEFFMRTYGTNDDLTNEAITDFVQGVQQSRNAEIAYQAVNARALGLAATWQGEYRAEGKLNLSEAAGSNNLTRSFSMLGAWMPGRGLDNRILRPSLEAEEYLWGPLMDAPDAVDFMGKLFDSTGAILTALSVAFDAKESILTVTRQDGQDIFDMNGVNKGKAIKLKVIKEEHPNPRLDGFNAKARSLRSELDRDASLGILEQVGAATSRVLAQNEFDILGIPDEDGVLYLPRSLINLPIARFHEAGEYYLARNPQLVPNGVNNHNYLRGCGKDVRDAYDKLTRQERKDLTNIIANLQKKMVRPIAESEKNLIQYNISQGKTDKDVLYGLQDVIFGVAANENLSSIIQQMGQRQEVFRQIENRASVEIMEHSRGILRRVRTMPRASRQLETKVLRLFELAKKTRDGVGADAKEGVDLLKALLVGSRPAWLDFGRNHMMDIEQFVLDGSNADALRFLGLDYIPSAPFPNSGVLLYDVEQARAVINTPEVQEYLKEIFGDGFPAISALTDVKEIINAMLKKDPNLIGIILGIPVADVKTYIKLRPASGYMADVPSYATRTQSPTEVEQSSPLQNIATGLAVTVTTVSGKKYEFFKTGSDIPLRAELLREGDRTYIVLIGNRYIDGAPEFGVELVRRGPISDEEAKDFVVESIYDQAEEGLKAYLVVNQGVKMFDNIYRMLKAVSHQRPAFVERGLASPAPSPRAFMLPEDVSTVLGDALQHYTHQRFEYFNKVTSDPARGISCLPAQRDAPATQIYQYDEKEVPEGESPISAFVVSPGGFVLINSRLLHRALGEARFAIATFTLALCTGICIRATKNGEVYYGIGHVVIGRAYEKPTRNLARDLRFICQQLEGFDNIELVADYIPDSYESFDETETRETIRREYPGVRRVELRSRKKMLDVENMMVAQDGAVVATENNEYFPYPWEARAVPGVDTGVAEETGLVAVGISAGMAGQADMARLGLSGLAKDGIEKLLGAVDARIRLVLNGHAGLNTSQIDDMRGMLERARGLVVNVAKEEDRAWLATRIKGYESGLSRLPTQVEVVLPDTSAAFAGLEGSQHAAEEALQSGNATQAQGAVGEFYARLDADAAALVPSANFRGFLGWLSAKVPATDRARPLIDTIRNHKDLLREGDTLLLLPQYLTGVDGDLREMLRQLTDATSYEHMGCIKNNILAVQSCEELMARAQAVSSNGYNEQEAVLNAYAALYIRTAVLANIVMALDFLTVANLTSDNAATVLNNLGYPLEERKINYPRRATPLVRAVLIAYKPYLVAQARLLRGAVSNIMADFGTKKRELDKLPDGYKYDIVKEEEVRKNLKDLERVGGIIDRLIAAMDDNTITRERLSAILNRDFLSLFNTLNNANFICVINPILEVAKVVELPKGPPARQRPVAAAADGIVVEEWGRQFLAGEMSAEALSGRIVSTPVREVQANIVRRVLESAPIKLDEFNRAFSELASRTPQITAPALAEGPNKGLDAMARREQEIAAMMTRSPAAGTEGLNQIGTEDQLVELRPGVLLPAELNPEIITEPRAPSTVQSVSEPEAASNATARTLDEILAANPELETAGMSKVREMLKTGQPRETQDMMRSINYTVDIYKAAREVVRETSVPNNPRTVFVPVSERFCPMSSIVLKGKEQATWKELRDRLSKEYNFSNLRVVFYDGTLQDLEDKMGKTEGLNAKNTVVYLDEAVANETPDKVKTLGAQATVVKEALTPRAELRPGEEEGAYISIGGHVALALGILDVVSESRTDREYLVLVTNLMTAISRKAVTPGELQEMLRKGDLRIQLPPITKIDINKNMNTFFIAEEAAMKSL